VEHNEVFSITLFASLEEETFATLSGVDVSGRFDMSALVLIGKSAIDQQKLIIEPTVATIENIGQLERLEGEPAPQGCRKVSRQPGPS
jgi:hypothetical protein